MVFLFSILELALYWTLHFKDIFFSAKFELKSFQSLECCIVGKNCVSIKTGCGSY